MYEIRDAHQNDIEYLKTLCEQLGYRDSALAIGDRLKFIQKKPNNKLFVAVDGEVVVGFLSCEQYDTIYFKPGLNITGLVVEETSRNKGIGQLLIRKAEDYAKEKNLFFLRAHSGAQRLDAHAFYRKNGFNNEKQQLRFIRNFEPS